MTSPDVYSVAMLGELQLVEKKINGGNPAVLGNDEISPGLSWRLTMERGEPNVRHLIAVTEPTK